MIQILTGLKKIDKLLKIKQFNPSVKDKKISKENFVSKSNLCKLSLTVFMNNKESVTLNLEKKKLKSKEKRMHFSALKQS